MQYPLYPPPPTLPRHWLRQWQLGCERAARVPSATRNALQFIYDKLWYWRIAFLKREQKSVTKIRTRTHCRRVRNISIDSSIQRLLWPWKSVTLVKYVTMATGGPNFQDWSGPVSSVTWWFERSMFYIFAILSRAILNFIFAFANAERISCVRGCFLACPCTLKICWVLLGDLPSAYQYHMTHQYLVPLFISVNL